MDNSEAKTIGQVLEQTGASETRNCEQHGEYESVKITPRYWSKCPVCSREESERREAEGKRLRDADELERRFRLSGLPPRFAGKTFDAYVAETDAQRRALEVAEAYARSFPVSHESGACLAFCGRAGTGKTHLAAAIADEVIRAGYWVKFVGVMQAIRSVKETFRKDSERSEKEALEEFLKYHLLILDEVGVQFGSDTEKLILFEIINTRYERLLPTIVISNLAKEGLEEYLGERAFDRLRENGGRLVVFDWDSHRKRAA